MTAIKAGQVDDIIQRALHPQIVVILLYGPHASLVTDRSAALRQKLAGNNNDPFALVSFEGDAFAADPTRLIDEAATVGLFGGSRTITVRVGRANCAPAVKLLLNNGSAAARVILEAGDLPKTSPLRMTCETAVNSLALPCYPDDRQTVSLLVDKVLNSAGRTIKTDARNILIESLGADRRVNLEELDKLILYTDGQQSVDPSDVEAVLSDVSTIELNSVIDSAFLGKTDNLELVYQRLLYSGLDPSVVLGAVLRHALLLYDALSASLDQSSLAVAPQWRGIHFSRKQFVQQQLTIWSTERLHKLTILIQESISISRRSQADFARSCTSSVLMRVAGIARKSKDSFDLDIRR